MLGGSSDVGVCGVGGGGCGEGSVVGVEVRVGVILEGKLPLP